MPYYCDLFFPAGTMALGMKPHSWAK